MNKVRSQKNARPRMLAFFLLLAILFWVLTKFSKDYTERVNAKIDYENPPENTMLGETAQANISFDVVGNGFEILMYRIKDPEVKVDVSRFYSDEDKQATVPNTELIRLISDQLGRNEPVKNLSVQDLQIGLNTVVTKRVPVKAISDITFKEGFKLVGTVTTEPDSIDISGPENTVNSIEFVATETWVQRNMDRSNSDEIALDYPEKSGITVSPDKVAVVATVSEFTQKSITVPVEVTNFDSDGTLKLIPETIVLTFDVSVEDFKNIRNSDFRVVCDYGQRNLEGNYMIPVLDTAPDGVFNVEIGAPRIDYLIFK